MEVFKPEFPLEKCPRSRYKGSYLYANSRNPISVGGDIIICFLEGKIDEWCAPIVKEHISNDLSQGFFDVYFVKDEWWIEQIVLYIKRPDRKYTVYDFKRTLEYMYYLVWTENRGKYNPTAIIRLHGYIRQWFQPEDWKELSVILTSLYYMMVAEENKNISYVGSLIKIVVCLNVIVKGVPISEAVVQYSRETYKALDKTTSPRMDIVKAAIEYGIPIDEDRNYMLLYGRAGLADRNSKVVAQA